MADWESALEAQAGLLAFWRSDRGAGYAKAFTNSLRQSAVEGDSSNVDLGIRLTERVAWTEAEKLERAEPIYVDENVLSLVEAAAPTWEPRPFVPGEAFTEFGFALLPRPVMMLDANERMTSVRAFSWGPEVVRVTSDDGHRDEGWMHLCLYADLRDEDDFNPSLREQATAQEFRGFHNGYLSMVHATVVPFNDEPSWLRGRTGELVEPGQPFHDEDSCWGLSRGFWQVLQTFWALADQRVFTRERTYGNRAARKRAKRTKHDNDGVLVVTLRRPKSPPKDEAGRTVDWSCSWVVGGHWRRQWYPSKNEHRQVWIGAYTKGPEDKPLLVHAGRAFRFVR